MKILYGHFIFLLTLNLLLSTFSSGQIDTMDINLENYQYPFPVKFLNLNIQQQNLVMAYMDMKAEKPNGKTVVLLHGKNFNGAYWKRTADTLKSAGYRVLIPDQVGFGKSSKPEHFQYSFHQLSTN